MIEVHRINGKSYILNCDMIKFVEATPDTIITLDNNEKIMVKESVEQIVNATKKYKHEVFTGENLTWK